MPCFAAFSQAFWLFFMGCASHPKTDEPSWLKASTPQSLGAEHFAGESIEKTREIPGPGSPYMPSADERAELEALSQDSQIKAKTLPLACENDGDCGYDPESKVCGSDPSFNRQPPLKDQGILCYCEANQCARLEIKPIPCEGDQHCGILMAPRPHPVLFGEGAVHKTPCAEGSQYKATCERTNICTMSLLSCKQPKR